jgi:FtsZ-binding cell division protein ZapB
MFDLTTIPIASDLISWVVVGLIGAALGLKKIISFFSKETRDVAILRSEIDVITLLREQIDHLAKANKDLRAEIEALRAINRNLIIENEEFKEEIRALRRYIEKYFTR